uniref:hypothetical protein n=1 Tax=Eubacterium sp. TaxID=142586 RepID=UPI00402832B8
QKAVEDKDVIHDLLEIWFKIGVVGIKKEKSIILYSNFSKRHLNVADYDKDFYIHPLFWRK